MKTVTAVQKHKFDQIRAKQKQLIDEQNPVIASVRIHRMPNGAARRKEILDLINSGFKMPVNRKYVHWNLRDPDLKYLLKRSLVSRIREPYGSVNVTYIVKNS